MQGNNEPSERGGTEGGTSPTGDAAGQKPIPQAGVQTQGLTVCAASHPHQALDDLLTCSPLADDDGFPAEKLCPAG